LRVGLVLPVLQSREHRRNGIAPRPITRRFASCIDYDCKQNDPCEQEKNGDSESGKCEPHAGAEKRAGRTAHQDSHDAATSKAQNQGPEKNIVDARRTGQRSAQKRHRCHDAAQRELESRWAALVWVELQSAPEM
jgi:hypothetical protein